jgi:NADP-dependent 3-hydroxy acid dehydrogenase YdfG
MELLSKKIIYITGASSGIGRACAEAFAREGANILISARRIDKLNELAKMIINKYNVDVFAFKQDIRNYEEVQTTIDALPDKWKDIDILINNAGLAKGADKLYEGIIENWEAMIDTNIKGLLYVTRKILPAMVKKEKGHIINIGSTAGHQAYTGGNVYCATKFAVNALTQSIRLDVYDKNIKVSTVDPGMVYTEFSAVRFSGDEEKVKKVYEGVKPLLPEDVAQAVLFCATRPSHVNINEIILTTTAQASATQIYRKK